MGDFLCCAFSMQTAGLRDLKSEGVGSDGKRHKGIKDFAAQDGQQLRGGSVASMGPEGLASNQSGFDLY